MHLDREKNLGSADRIIRAAAGMALLALAYTGVLPGWWAIAAAAFAFFQFVEAYSGY